MSAELLQGGGVRRMLGRGRRRVLEALGWRFCPLCGSSFRRFERYPHSYELLLEQYGFRHAWTSDAWEMFNPEAYICPVCRATDRERLYALFLASRLPAGAAGARPKVLDIGPTRPMRHLLRKRLGVDYRSADFQPGVADDQVDVTNMSIYADGAFDAVICSHVLEHVPDDRRAMAELFRILKPGGWGIVVSPISLRLRETDEDPGVTDPAERWRRFGQEDHVRIYTRDEFIKRLQSAGFLVKRLAADSFGEAALRRHGITPHSALYLVTKPGSGESHDC